MVKSNPKKGGALPLNIPTPTPLIHHNGLSEMSQESQYKL